MTHAADEMIDAKALDRLDTQLAQLEADRAELAREAKDLLKRAVGVHEGALALARKLKAMSPVQRAAYLTHLNHYVAVWRLDDQPDLFEPHIEETKVKGRFRVVT